MGSDRQTIRVASELLQRSGHVLAFVCGIKLGGPHNRITFDGPRRMVRLNLPSRLGGQTQTNTDAVIRNMNVYQVGFTMRSNWHCSFLSAVHCHRMGSEELVPLVHLTEPRCS